MRGNRILVATAVTAISLWLPALLVAQTEPAASPQESGTRAEPRRERESQAPPPGGRSLIDSVVDNLRNKAGFTLGLMGLYDSDVAPIVGGPARPSAGGIVSPTVFANLRGRKSTFHVDYEAARRLYFERREFDSTSHAGNLRLGLALSRRWTLDLSDNAQSAPANVLSLTGGYVPPGSPGGTPPGPGIIPFQFERVTMNTAAGRLSYRANRKTTLGFYGTSEIFRYARNNTNNMNPYTAGAFFNRQVTRRLTATADFYYGNYDTVSGSRRERITHLNGGMNYRVGRFWLVLANGGIQWVDIFGSRYTPSFVEVGFGRRSTATNFSVVYHKAAQYQLGTPLLFDTQSVSATLDHRLTRRASIQMSGRYYRSSPFAASSRLRTFLATGGFQLLLQSHIVGLVNASYVHQERGGFGDSARKLERYVVYAGIALAFPSVRRAQDLVR